MPIPIPTPAPQSLASLAASGAGLAVQFAWLGDRYQHVVLLQRPDGSTRPLLASVEGNAADDWPESPPLQSLSIERLAEGRTAALLVGMAGRSHWSASIEARGDGGELVFDLACRHRANLAQLGSRYRWLLPAQERTTIAIAACPGCITDNGEVLTIAPIAASNTAASNTVASNAAAKHPVATTRWQFTLRSSRPRAVQ